MQSKKDIEEKLGQAVTAFSYPNGDYNADIIRLLREGGFTCAVTTKAKLIVPEANPFELGRIGAMQDFNQFKVVFSGLYHDLKVGRLLELLR
jgi:peptidoglycan/xylan/chitin deacetylase (PgdA/CDA1 family)